MVGMPDDFRLTLALFEPDIAANAGAILRTCACLGADAALIEPAGFFLDDSRFKRAGMDYLPWVHLARHASWAAFEGWLGDSGSRLVLLTTHGATPLWDFRFEVGDVLLVGRESAGVPAHVAARAARGVKIPMRPPMRSLNVSVSAGIALAEATRQLTTRAVPPA
jgi:tRNA (cytidine/uridine-2'-O-)-methyltransferase